MTWIVGATSIFGYSVIVSDIQVTCGDSGRRKDILQKAFPMGKYIAAGFAGDVRAGFALLTSLNNFLDPGDISDDECWQPDWVADHWPSEARRVYHDLSVQRTAGDTHILMVGAQPQGTDEKRVLGGAIGHISVFRSPDFTAECQDGGRKAMSIGCGSDVEDYAEALEHIMRDPGAVYMKGEMASVGGHGRMIAVSLQMTVQRNPTLGISKHFHLISTRLGAVEQYSTQDMPAVARTWTELNQMLDKDMDAALLTAARS